MTVCGVGSKDTIDPALQHRRRLAPPVRMGNNDQVGLGQLGAVLLHQRLGAVRALELVRLLDGIEALGIEVVQTDVVPRSYPARAMTVASLGLSMCEAAAIRTPEDDQSEHQRGLTFDMSGGLETAPPGQGCPLDGAVLHCRFALPEEKTKGPVRTDAHLHGKCQKPKGDRQRGQRAEMNGRLQDARTKKPVRQWVRDGRLAGQDGGEHETTEDGKALDAVCMSPREALHEGRKV